MVPLALVLILAACRGSPQREAQPGRTVTGSGFTLRVPPLWSVQRRAAGSLLARQGSALVAVTRYTLLKPYEPSLFSRAARELDKVARTLAADAAGTLTERATTTVDGRRIRAYRFTGHSSSGGATETRIGFVLLGRTEYELLCQAPAGAGDPDGACALLFGSFSVR